LIKPENRLSQQIKSRDITPTIGEHLIEEEKLFIEGDKANGPTALLWGIFNYKNKGTLSPYNPCHSFPQQAVGYSGIFL